MVSLCTSRRGVNAWHVATPPDLQIGTVAKAPGIRLFASLIAVCGSDNSEDVWISRQKRAQRLQVVYLE